MCEFCNLLKSNKQCRDIIIKELCKYFKYHKECRDILNNVLKKIDESDESFNCQSFAFDFDTNDLFLNALEQAISNVSPLKNQSTPFKNIVNFGASTSKENFNNVINALSPFKKNDVENVLSNNQKILSPKKKRKKVKRCPSPCTSRLHQEASKRTVQYGGKNFGFLEELKNKGKFYFYYISFPLINIF